MASLRPWASVPRSSTTNRMDGSHGNVRDRPAASSVIPPGDADTTVSRWRDKSRRSHTNIVVRYVHITTANTTVLSGNAGKLALQYSRHRLTMRINANQHGANRASHPKPHQTSFRDMEVGGMISRITASSRTTMCPELPATLRYSSGSTAISGVDNLTAKLAQQHTVVNRGKDSLDSHGDDNQNISIAKSNFVAVACNGALSLRNIALTIHNISPPRFNVNAMNGNIDAESSNIAFSERNIDLVLHDSAARACNIGSMLHRIARAVSGFAGESSAAAACFICIGPVSRSGDAAAVVLSATFLPRDCARSR
ncbi:MAG: hypothetical protein H7Z14_09625 [Anaerolineae bacterium]|nr:hypothetical protein [Phycisphaerae bacterium]